jgi:hypothetical protein
VIIVHYLYGDRKGDGNRQPRKDRGPYLCKKRSVKKIYNEDGLLKVMLKGVC